MRKIIEFTPYILLSYFLSNVLYLSVISLLPNVSFSPQFILLLHTTTSLTSLYLLYGYKSEFNISKRQKYYWLLLVPLSVLFIRFPLVYPTYDDLAFHFIAGEYANNLWGSANFMPLNWVNYFYPAVDMMFTPLLHLVGIRVTILLYFLFSSVWLVSIYLRLIDLFAGNMVKKLLTTIVFIIIPFIPHLMATHGTLMVDYFGLIISLESILQISSRTGNKTFAVLIAMLAILAKQSSVIVLLPVFVYFTFKSRKLINYKVILLFTFISSIYFIRLFIETGNPIYGLYNGLFKSELFEISNFRDQQFGPTTLVQSVIWPVYGQFTERYGQGYVSKIAQIFFAWIPIVSIIGSTYFLFVKRSFKYFAILIAYYLWSFTTGYSRYVIPLNIITLLLLIRDLPPAIKINKSLTKLRYVAYLSVFILSFSTIKTDFSWRPYPSLKNPASTKWFVRSYTNGINNAFSDTPKNMAEELSDVFRDYDAVITIYRGSTTFFSYLGYLQDLNVYDAKTSEQYLNILNDQKIGDHLKNNMRKSVSHGRVLLAVEKNHEFMHNQSYQVYQDYNCEASGEAPPLSFFQLPTFFENINLYSCTKK